MKKKLKLLRLNRYLNSGVTCFLLFMFCFVLLASCMFYTTGSFKKSMNGFIHNILESCSLNIAQSFSHVYQYYYYLEHSVDENVVVQLMSQVFPFQTYIVNHEKEDFSKYVQAAQLQDQVTKELNLSNDMDYFLFYNGNIYDDRKQLYANNNSSDGDTFLVTGESFIEDETTRIVDVASMESTKQYFSLEQLSDYNFFMNNCYIVDPSTLASEALFDADHLLEKDNTMELSEGEPQILIYHTHSQETFSDSKSGVVADSVVGVGAVLAAILEEQYGYTVIHDTTTYDLVDGKLDRNLAYSVALPSITKTLEFNPSIEAVIDLHRDGVTEETGKRVTTINGEECAQIMFFNGLSTNTNGPIETLQNPFIEDNLSFSLQLFMRGKNLFPDLMVRTYLKAYRFNQHVAKKALLIELGTQYNTVGEAKNSMKYLAKLLSDVLNGND